VRVQGVILRVILPLAVFVCAVVGFSTLGTQSKVTSVACAAMGAAPAKAANANRPFDLAINPRIATLQGSRTRT
jgi:hypothetical protein